MASILVFNAAPTVELFDPQWGHKLIADAYAAPATAAATTPCSVFTTASSTDDDRVSPLSYSRLLLTAIGPAPISP